MSEEKLRKLAEKLRPNNNDKQQYGAAINAASEVLRRDNNISVAEVWICGSIGKNTGVRTKSDIDMVVLLSPSQDMNNIFELFKKALQGSSSIPIKSSKRAIQVVIHGIEMDILPTKYGMTNELGRAQNDNKLVSDIVQLGQLFSGAVRLLKYWRDYPDNAPLKDNITSFEIEIIIADLMRKRNYSTHTEVLKAFFDYVISDKLVSSIDLRDHNNNKILEFNFDFKNKEYFINQSKYALKLLKKEDLTFMGL